MILGAPSPAETRHWRRIPEENLASIARNGIHTGTFIGSRSVMELFSRCACTLNPLKLTPQNMNRYLVCLIILITTPAVPANAQISKLFKKSAETKTTDDAAATQLPEYKGVKQAVGVSDFTNEASYRSQWTLGDNLRFMLESALFETGRFVIVERAELGHVMAEQDLQAGGRAAASTDVAQTGKIRSARYIASGAVTEVSDDTSGDGGGIGIRGLRIGVSSSKSAVVVMVKLIDTTTGEVVASKRIRGEAGKTGLRLGVARHGVGGDLSSFAKTPLGEAAQDCIDQAVKFIAENMEDFEIEGSVVTLAGDQIVVSLGENYGIGAGQKLTVRTEGEILTDPATGAVLDKIEGETIATIEVTRVRDKISYCKLLDGTMPERGATVVVLH
jgi:curli biogenesis system outer membrane secretion channel CsgG